MHEEAPHYLAARIQRRLAEDTRTVELGIQVDVRGDVIFLRGQVASARRRALIEAVAREAAGDRRIANDVTVVQIRRPTADAVHPDPGEPERPARGTQAQSAGGGAG